MKKSLRMLIALLAVFTLLAAACGDDDDTGADDGGGDTTTTAGEGGGDTTPDAGAGGPIYVLLPDSATSPRWESLDRRFFQEGFEAAGLTEGEDFTILNAEGDSATQISQAEQAVLDGASVVLLVNLDSATGATITDIAREGGAKVIDYDRFTADGDGADVYVSFDNVAVGRVMAETLTPLIDEIENPNVVMLNGGPTDNNSQLFRSGYAETAEAKAEAGEWTIIADQFVDDWDAANAQTAMEQILVDNGNDVDAVFAANDNLANAAITAIEAAGLDATEIPISGQDASIVAMQNLLRGKQTMSVYKPIEPLAAAAVQAALALRDGTDLATVSGDWDVTAIEVATGTPTDAEPGDGVVLYWALTPSAITADNIADTVIADGVYTWDEICTGDVADLCPSDGE